MTRLGLVAGAVGALAMTAVFFIAQAIGGVAIPSELFADVSAPYIPVHLFGMLIGFAGGYTQLKLVGIVSVIAGQFAVGLACGMLIARTSERRRPVVAAGAVAVLWIVSIVAFWPVLITSYIGLPPASARIATGFVLLAGYGAYAAKALAVIRAATIAPVGSRRAFIAGTAGVAGLAAVGSGAALATRTVFGYDGTEYAGPDVAAITPVSRFYVVTKNSIDPNVDRALWRLAVGGAVDRPFELAFDELARRPNVVQETTLMCINNPPDGGLMSNAVWRGVRVRDLLAQAGPANGAVDVAFHSVDSIVEAIPFAKALDPTTIVAFEMNGGPLPPRHGFPVRAIVPGLFGEKQVKWLTKISVSTATVADFYGKQGWGPSAEIRTHARFDRPDLAKPVRFGAPVELGGVAFCGDRGVSRVELSVDGGDSWRATQLVTPYRQLAWRLWHDVWRPERPGTYHLAVRATDGRGRVQTAAVHGAETEGATGLVRVTVHVV